jgi:hypothetical protein
MQFSEVPNMSEPNPEYAQLQAQAKNVSMHSLVVIFITLIITFF